MNTVETMLLVCLNGIRDTFAHNAYCFSKYLWFFRNVLVDLKGCVNMSQPWDTFTHSTLI